MGKSKSKKLKQKMSTKEPKNVEVPIKNLPEKFLRMQVKSGTKIKHVLEYALKEFPSYNSIVWIGIGQGIAKAISCAELFKRKHEGLHQVTKLHYVDSKCSKEDTAVETRRVPELHILLTKDVRDITELGYQAPGDCGEFPEKEDVVGSKTSTTIENASNTTRVDSHQFAVKLKIGTGGKRNSRSHNAEPPPKKKKKSTS